MTSEHIFNTVRADTLYGSGAGLTSINPTSAFAPMTASSAIHTDALGHIVASAQLAPSMGGTGADLSATTGGLVHVLANTDGTIANGAVLAAYGSDTGTIPIRGTTGIIQTGAQGFTVDALGTELSADREFVQLVWNSGTSRFVLQTQSAGSGELRDLMIGAPLIHVPGHMRCEQAPVDVEDIVRKADLDAIAAGIAWKSPVLAIADEPIGPHTGGDRYIALSTAGTWTINNIYEWDADTTTWIESIPTTGWACLVLGGAYYPNQSVVFTIGTVSEWKPMGISIDHYNLIHRGTYTHDQIDAHINTTTTDPHAAQDLRTSASPTHASLTLAHASAPAPALIFDGSAAAGATSLTLGDDGAITYARTDTGTTGQTGINMANGWIATDARLVAPLLAPSTGTVGVRVAPDDDVHVATHALESYSATGETLRLIRTGAPDAPVALEVAVTGELYVDAPVGAQVSTQLGVGMASSADATIVALSATDDQFRAYYDPTKWMAIRAESDGSATLSCATADKPIYVDIGNPFVITSTDAEALVVDGGAYIGSTLPATSAGTGALIVDGGASFGEGARVDGTATTGVLRAVRAGDYPQASFDDTLSEFRVHVNGTALGNTVSLYSYGATLGGSSIYLGSLNGAGATGIPIADVDIAGNASFGASINGGVSTYIALTCDTDSTSVDTGSIHTAGGIGCARNLYVGAGAHIVGALTFDGILTVTNTTASTSTATGCATFAGGIGVAGALFAGGAIRTNSTTASSSVSTGALISDGGLGVAGSAYINTLRITDTTSSTGSNTGCATFVGGIGVAGDSYITGRLYAARVGGYPQIYVTNGANESMQLYVTDAGKACIYFVSAVADPEIRIGASDGTSNYTRVRFPNTAASTSATTGAVVYDGGVGIAGALFVGGAIRTTSTTASSSVSTGALISNGGLGVAGNSYIGGLLRITDTTASTSTITGCATFAGGVGIVGALFVGGAIRTNSTTASSSVSTGALISDGGLGVAGNAYIGGLLRITDSTTSTSTTTGALVVSGGLGIAGALFTGGAIRTNSTTASSSVSTGALIVDGGCGIAGAMFVGGAIRTTSTTASSSVSTGALITDGGFGCAGSAYINTLRITSNTEADGTITTGCATFAGGVTVSAKGYFGGQLFAHRLGSFNQLVVKNGTTGATSLNFYTGSPVYSTAGQACIFLTSDVTRNLFIGSHLDGTNMHTVTFANTAASTSTTTGAVIVGGGVGIGGSTYVGGRVTGANMTCTTAPSVATDVVRLTDINSMIASRADITTTYWGQEAETPASNTTITVQRFGGIVVLSIRSVNYTMLSTGYLTRLSSAVPYALAAIYRPTIYSQVVVCGIEIISSVDYFVMIKLAVDTDGRMYLSRAASTGTWNTGTIVQIPELTITYLTAV